MNFKGTEVSPLYTNNLMKKTKIYPLIYKEKNKEDNPFIISRLRKKTSLNRVKESNKNNDVNYENKCHKLFFVSFFSKGPAKKDKENVNPTLPNTPKNSFYSEILFLCKLRLLLTLNLCRFLLNMKHVVYRTRLKRSQVGAKKNSIYRAHNRRKKQLKREHFRFFSMSKPTLKFKEAWIGLNTAQCY